MRIALLLVGFVAVCRANEVIKVENAEKAFVEVSNANFSTADVFVPTEDWQEIMPGQAIPKGLHVRINLETGKKEAKFLDQEKEIEKKESIGAIDDDAKVVHTKSDSLLRSYQDLQDFMAKEKMRLNSEFEHVEALMSRYHNSTDEQRLFILEDLDYYLHQVDNARDFVAFGGMESVVKMALDSENEDVREKGAILFGGCVQSHPDVQARVLGAGWLPDLLKRLAKPEETPYVRLRLMHALTCLVRGNENALTLFRTENGFAELLKLTVRPDGKIDFRMGRKVLVFWADLAALTGEAEPQLVSTGPIFHKLVETVVNQLGDVQDLDQIEKRAYLLVVFGDKYGFQLKAEDSKKLLNWAEEAKKEVEARSEDNEFADVLVNLEGVSKLFSGRGVKEEL